MPSSSLRPGAAPAAGMSGPGGMSAADIGMFVVLSALWGGSFMLARVAAPAFGAMPTMALRCAIAAALLVPVALVRGGFGRIVRMPGRIFAAGLLNSAIPFAFFGHAALTLPAGVISILNAMSPLWGALVAWAWLGERLSRAQLAGLLVAFAGVGVLVAGRGGLGGRFPLDAVLAPFAATLMYGVAANYMRRFLAGEPALASAAGTQLTAAIALLPFGILFWPEHNPGAIEWGATIALGVLGTAIPYVLYFRLISRVGPARAIAVTFLIPVFGVLWGAWLLDESVNTRIVVGAATIVLGTALSTGVLLGRRSLRR